MAYQLTCDLDESSLCLELSPPLKWAGGKRWLVPVLQSLYHPYRDRRLVEPFVGGLSVVLGLRPKQALLNDLNPHLINFYRNLQRGLQVSIPLRNDKLRFYAARRRFNLLIEQGKSRSAESAELFYYLNRTCFNGLCRFNSRGYFNVPFGRYSSIPYVRDFRRYRSTLARWRFSSQDFEQLDVKRSDFVYLDPPYDVQFTRYAKDDFTWEDQERLALWASKLRGPVVASNQATDRIVRLYKKLRFDIKLLSAPRMISCSGDRSRTQEILATRNC